MRWNDVPENVSFAMSRDTAMEMRAGKPKAFMWGMACGAVCLLALQSCGADDSKSDSPSPSPKPSVSSTHKPNH